MEQKQAYDAINFALPSDATSGPYNLAVNGAWAESVAQINARVASQPGHTPQVLQGPSMLRPALPGYVPSQTPSEAPRSDDALIEPDLDPEASDDDAAPVTAPTTEPRR